MRWFTREARDARFLVREAKRLAHEQTMTRDLMMKQLLSRVEHSVLYQRKFKDGRWERLLDAVVTRGSGCSVRLRGRRLRLTG
jgi:hypothetical protein